MPFDSIKGGELVKPRAIAIGPDDHLYIVDFTARIQVFDRDGHYLDHCWTTPDYRNGRPSGLSMSRDGDGRIAIFNSSLPAVFS